MEVKQRQVQEMLNKKFKREKAMKERLDDFEANRDYDKELRE